VAVRTKKPLKKKSHMDRLCIEPDAIRMIAARSALSVKGVYKLGKTDGEVLTSITAKDLKESVVLKEKSGRLEIEVLILAVFRENIQLLSERLQKSIRTTVFSMTGFEVDKVVVRIVGIDISVPSTIRSTAKKR